MLSCYFIFSDDFLGVPNPNVNNQEAGPLKKYDETVRSGKLKLDRHQRQIVEHLQRLYNDVVSYKPTSGGFFSKVCLFQIEWNECILIFSILTNFLWNFISKF